MDISLIAQKIFRRVLKGIFRFDHWHTSVLDERPYAVDIINYCNSRNSKDSILEIGCGLADILRRVDYKTKLGFDIDKKVLKGAAFLSTFSRKPKIKYQVFHFPETRLEALVDVIIMVNWIFFIEEDTLRKNIEKYFRENVKPGGAVIIDTLKDPHYPNHHNIYVLTANLQCKIHKIGNYARQREVWSIEKQAIVA
jgi:SAM-dependent methyltransferase